MPNDLLIFLRISNQTRKNSLRAATKLEWGVGIFFSTLTLLFFAGIGAGLWRFFGYLENVPYIGEALAIKVISMAFLSLFSMLIFSSMVTSFTTIFFARDLPFLLSTPLEYGTVFTYKFIETAFYSSWMVIVAMIPVIVSYGIVKHMNILFYFTTFGVMIPYCLVASGLGVLISMVLMYLFPTAKTKDAVMVLSVVVGCGMYVFLRFLEPEQFMKPDKLTEIVQYLNFIQAPTAVYLPSWWMTGVVKGFALHQPVELWFYSLLLISSGLLTIALITKLSEVTYFTSWARAQESVGKRPVVGGWGDRTVDLLLHLFPQSWRALAKKDLKLFFRDPNQWTQLLLLGALIVVYIFNIDKLPLDNYYLKNIAAFFNIGLAGFVISAVALRFVYPALSIEAESFWVLRSAPLSSRQIVWSKYWLTFLPVFVLGLAISVVSNLLLRVDTFVFWLSTGAVIVSIFALTGLAMGMGAVYPRFRVENVAQVESSFGGIMYMVYSLFYNGFVLAVLAWPLIMHFKVLSGMGKYSAQVTVSAVLTVAGVSVLVFIIPLIIGVKRVELMENE
ncbi:MAG: hypothetical protein WC955_00425 [Elusimicrobiota bacterium]